MPVFTLSERLSFPPVHMAIREGLLAVGGDLCVDRLVLAYRKGIFPWYSPGAPILWWSPDPRLVLFPDELKVSRSLNKLIRQHRFRITLDVDFEAVIRACAETPRAYGGGTWITPEMKAAYCALHRHGVAHSVEAWQEDTLVGGLYGVAMGRVFFGESMFSRVSNASKVAFVTLVAHLRQLDFALVDCQVRTDHLMRFGAREIPRKLFLEILSAAIDDNTGGGDSVTPPVCSLFAADASHHALTHVPAHAHAHAHAQAHTPADTVDADPADE